MADEEKKSPLVTKGHMVGGGIVASLLAIQPLLNMFSPKEVTEVKFAALDTKISLVDKKIDDNQKQVMDRFDRLAQSMKERDREMESRHERDVDHITTRIETLEAARMSVSKRKNN